MRTEIIGCIPRCIDKLDCTYICNASSVSYSHMLFIRQLLHKVRGLRTFLLCLKQTGWIKDDPNSYSVYKYLHPELEFPEPDHVEIDGNNDNSEQSDQLESLLEQIKDFLIRILFIDRTNYIRNIFLGEELDQWYTILSDFLPQALNSPVANGIEDIFNSISENIEDFLSLRIAHGGTFVAPVKALKRSIIFWRDFLRFASLLVTDKRQEFQDLMTNVERLALSAAHFTVHINVFSEFETYQGNDRVRESYETSYDRFKYTVDALLLKINPLHNPHLYENYSQALESMRCSREYSYVSSLDIQGSTAFLLSSLWESLQFYTGQEVRALKFELQKLYEGLRYLRALVKKHPNKFDGAVGAIARAGIFEAGVIIFSVYQNMNGIDHDVEEFLGTIKIIQAQVEEQVSKFNFPKTTVLPFLDFLLNYLMQVESPNVDSDRPSCVQIIREYLFWLRSFVEKLVKLTNLQLEDLHQAVWKSALEVAYKIELLIDQLVLGDILDSDLMSLQSITEEMEMIKADSAKISDDLRRAEIKLPQEVITSTNTDQVTSQSSISSTDLNSLDEFVGFEDERVSIIDRLKRGSKKLQVVAIVGMPGLGKTTLATKVYNEPSVQQHFHVLAKCSFSQQLNKRKVLLELLNQITGLKSDEDSSKMTDDDLADQLRRSLLRRRYLIYIDDVWEVKAFESFKLTFPTDSSGRILLTSRIGDVAKLDAKPLFLRQLTFSESLELLQRKVSFGKDWPQSLHDIAVKIAENGKGLPLIITIVAGLLATTKREVWEEVLGSLTSGIISSTDQCQRTIELSYKHLPEHLKPCLLLFGSFPEDEEISVKRLIWLWIAEGFVQKTDSSSVEQVAENYLKDLIGRSLVMNSQKRNGGGIKTCRIHDLLLDFCLRKSNEENSLHLLNGKEEVLHFEESRNLRRLCVHSDRKDFIETKLVCPRLRSLTFFGEKWRDEKTDISFIFRIFEQLRVLSMEKVEIVSYYFPGEVDVLVHLRYLAITVSFEVSPSVGCLSQLETLILSWMPFSVTDFKQVTMPDTFWNLRKMRNFLLKTDGEDKYRRLGIILPVDNSCNFHEMESLSGIYSPFWCIMEDHLRNFPNIRRLKFSLHDFGYDYTDGSKVMSFSFLSRLESLTLSFFLNFVEFEFSFLPNIKKLNLCFCRLSWDKISRIAQLPNLEVLKLRYQAFIGEKWQMEEGDFSQLRFLKLEGLDVINWTSSCDDQFPNLEKLVVKYCDNLEEIPAECLESVETLEMIEVIHCSDHLAGLFKTVADYQKARGNSVLQLHVEPTSTSEPSPADEEDED